MISAVALATGIALTGCSTTVSVDPAKDANNPECARVSVLLPSSLGGQDRVWTNAQATGAWGSPTSVIVACGVTPPGPSTLPCQTVGGVDWLIDDAEAPRYRVTTFGRVPAVEVFMDTDIVSSLDVLDSLSRIVGILPTDGAVCTDVGSTTPDPADD